MTFILRAYQPDQDGPEVFKLYQATIGTKWPLTYDQFRQVTSGHDFYRPGDHFVAGSEGSLIGFAATQVHRFLTAAEPVGGLQVIFVAPENQRRGVGRALHNIALEHIRKADMTIAQVAGGGMVRLWPGIPEDLAESRGFFEKMGWKIQYRVCDLVRDVSAYEIPAELQRRMAAEGIDLHPAREDEVQTIIDFEERNFPGSWQREFIYKASQGEHSDMLAAWQKGKGVVASLMMYSPASKLPSVNLVWKEMLGNSVGGMGAVGVAQSMRGRGIGIALVAWGSAILKARRAGNVMIDWTGLVDFYGKAGYQPWRWYRCPAAIEL